MRFFVVRPFGTKEGIDFERVSEELIQPAVARLAQYGFPMNGGTTGTISRQGNIREDMFRLIVTADLVIADVSIHNANVFYELGIRHALRPRSTFLIRNRTDQPYPFDLQTDRYFLYDAAKPGEKLDELVQALRSSLAATERDSPVFALLPRLSPHGRAQLVKVPADFQEDVERTCRDQRRGDLRLLAFEASAFDWDHEGLRQVGEAQLKLRAFADAKETFELLRAAAPDDIPANLRLGTICQRLTLTEPSARRESLLVQSEHAIQRVLAGTPSVPDRAEAYSLMASNEKSRWIDEFTAAPAEARPSVALLSPRLGLALDWYLKACRLDLNAHYPAVNALALLKLQLAMAARMPATWQEAFDDAAQADTERQSRERLAARLASSLSLALGMDEVMGRGEVKNDRWAASSRAGLLLLTASDQPQRTMREYRQALVGADRFTLDAMRRNLRIFKELGEFEPGVSAALAIVDQAIADTDNAGTAPSCVIVFTGHMVDRAETPASQIRFPRTARARSKARKMILEAVQKELSGNEASALGIAGGACGGDILFHDVCRQLGCKTELYLALPENKFEVTSVEHGGAEWVEQYRSLTAGQVPWVLQQTEDLPRWLTDKTGYDLWQRNNLWMMFNALATGSRQLTLIALFNREREEQGPGGTGHLVEESRKRGFKYIELDARELLSK